jgi:hypothetical protein
MSTPNAPGGDETLPTSLSSWSPSFTHRRLSKNFSRLVLDTLVKVVIRTQHQKSTLSRGEI